MGSEEYIIENYRLFSWLGSGAFGDVCLAQHIFLTNRIVAIKIMRSNYAGDLQEIVRFLNEPQILEKLKHPFILPIINVGIDKGIPYQVTEYASGGSLRGKLQQRPNKPLPLTEAITILTQVGQALQFAHEQNIIHRDLKPENILFNEKGNAILADFGIATTLTTASVKQTNAIGTLAYMAPEEFQDEVSKESDQYALGVIAYELFTGHMPFQSSNQASMLFEKLMEEPIPPRFYLPELPEHIEKAVLKAMAKRRTDRHASISAFITSIIQPASFPFRETNQKRGPLDANTKKPESGETTEANNAEAISARRKNKRSYFNQGLLLKDAGRFEEALEAFDHSLALEEDGPGWLYKAKLLKQLGKLEEAKLAYAKAKELRLIKDDEFGDFDDYSTGPESTMIPIQSNNTITNTADVLLDRGITLEQQGQIQEALACFERALNIKPDYALASLYKGNALSALGDYAEALIAYGQATRLGLNSIEVYFQMGIALDELGSFEDALLAYEKVIQINPNVAEVHNNKGNTLKHLGRYSEAAVAYEKAIKLAPDDFLTYSNIGSLYLVLRKFQEAFVAFERAVRLNPDCSDAHHGIGVVLSETGSRREALAAYDQAIHINPNKAEIWRSKGKTLLEMRQYQLALSDFQRAIQLNPKLTSAYNDKGNALNLLNRYYEALHTFEQLIQIDPCNADGYNGKGNSLNALARFDEALMAFDQAIQLEPNEAIFHNNRAEVLQRLGRLKEAQQAYEKVRQLKGISTSMG